MTIQTPTTRADLTSNEQDAVLQAARIPDYDARWPAMMHLLREQKAAHAGACEQRDEFARVLDQARAALATERAELARFKEQVREVAIRVQEAQDWCVDGLNDVLDELGLPRKEREYEVEVTITAVQTVTVTVTAEDEDDAKFKVREGEVDLNDEIDRYGWEWQTADDLEFKDVREA